MLLAAGTNRNDKDGLTPLHVATENGHAEVIKMLLAAGANKDAADKDGCTPLYIAAEDGHAEVIKMRSVCGTQH